MRSDWEVNRAIEQYADTVKRICLYRLKNPTDAEDIFQEVFLKYYLREEPFLDETHEKAWFLRVTINACKDHLRSLFRHRTTPLELLKQEPSLTDEHLQVLSALLSLPEKYRDVIYLHYYEGYSAPEMAEILHKKENTIYSLLSRGRSMLSSLLGGECNG